MAIYHCTGCDHSTNTVFVDLIADRGANCTVIRCGGRYVHGGAVNEVERGCGYDTLDAYIREHVDRAIRNSRERLAAAEAAETAQAKAVPTRGIPASDFISDFIAQHPNEWAEAQHRMQATMQGA